MNIESTPFDYHGALVIVETKSGEIVFVHPAGGTPEASASLPSDPCQVGESPEIAAVRIVREKTGLDVTIVKEFTTFIQEGTPTGTMCAHGYVAHVTGGQMFDVGPEGRVESYPLSSLPQIVPIRVANQRTLDAYLTQETGGRDEVDSREFDG
jgi:ADP-ribose pyrophosphatase YjhB (NUDIX family)